MIPEPDHRAFEVTLGYKRPVLVEGAGIPLGRVLAPANRHDSPLLAPTLDKLGELGPLPDKVTVHLDAGYERHNNYNRLQRCYERDQQVIDAYFNLADAVITLRRLIREAWTLYRWDSRPAKRP